MNEEQKERYVDNSYANDVRKEDVVATYDWCWECCKYHKNGEKQCRKD